MNERGPGGLLTTGKKPRTALPPPPLAAETLVIHTLASAKPNRPRPEAAENMDHVPLEEGRPDRKVQLDREMEAATRNSLVSLL